MEIKATKRGGARPGAGRKPGVRDRATGEQRASLEELARTYTELALLVLVDVAEQGESDSAKVAAANAILDRGYGRPRQAMDVTADLKVENVDAGYDAIEGALGELARAKKSGADGSSDVDTESPAEPANT